MARRSVAPTIAILALFLAGCFSPAAPSRLSQGSTLTGSPSPELGAPGRPAPSSSEASHPASESPRFDTSGPYSKTLTPGPYHLLSTVHANLTGEGGTTIATVAWLPSVPPGSKVGVVIDAGPYYAPRTGEVDPDSVAHLSDYENAFTIPTIVDHGFAYVHVAVRGTSQSGGCMEFFSPAEQSDLNTAVTYYGTRPWSNGNVALWGKSYDGSTPWVVAAFGNPYLKTIVPEEGITSVYNLISRNGTPSFLSAYIAPAYWLDGIGVGTGHEGDEIYNPPSRAPAAEAEDLACPDAMSGFATAIDAAAGGGSAPPGPDGSYWADRDFQPGVLQHYHGSVFLVQGLADWRVPSDQDFPFVEALRARGVPVKILAGQWAHELPDDAQLRTGPSVRWDFAETLYRWFDRYLNDNLSATTGPWAESEDSTGAWHASDAWPPSNTTWTPLYLGSGTLRTKPQSAGSLVLPPTEGAYGFVQDQSALVPEASSVSGPTTGVAGEYKASSGPLPSPLRFAGSVQLPLTVEPTSPAGGRVYAELDDMKPNGSRMILAHAVMDLRFADGGSAPRTVTPNAPLVARMEFYPADAVVPAGDTLLLRIANGDAVNGQTVSDTVDSYLPSPDPTPWTLLWGGNASVLRLPVVPSTGSFPQ
jgi:predicted acyl esterase